MSDLNVLNVHLGPVEPYTMGPVERRCFSAGIMFCFKKHLLSKGMFSNS